MITRHDIAAIETRDVAVDDDYFEDSCNYNSSMKKSDKKNKRNKKDKKDTVINMERTRY